MTEHDAKLADAVTAHQKGDLARAEQIYRVVVENNPNNADACALLGVVIGARGDFPEAIKYVDRAVALDPNSGLFHFHRGTVLMAAQHLPDAIAAFIRARDIQSDIAPVHYNLANALRASGDWTGAIDSYRAALTLDPTMLEAYNNLALSLSYEKEYLQAQDMAMQAVARNATYGDGWLTLCNVAEKLKDYHAALTAGLRATQLMPDSSYAWFGYGVALNRLDRDDEAVVAYKRAIELNPTRIDVWDNLAQTYQSLNLLDEAEATYRHAIELAEQVIVGEDSREVAEGEYGNRHWHLALMELLRGKYAAGFARYRARFASIAALKRLPMPMPLWKGEDLTGKRLLVCDEQGYGDTLMLARFLPLLKARGAETVFSVHPVLIPLLRGWNGADLVIAHEEKVPHCDYFCSSFDLPHRLGITLDTLPQQTPYVPVLPPDVATFVSAGTATKVGVVWGGSPLHLNDARRSVPLRVFADLFSLPNFKFYSFNRDLKPGDADLLPTYPIENLVPALTDFAAAARLIDQMDLVITCDTATAHLAGALGKKIWVLLAFAPDWRWLTGRSDSPWYPNARLFRQPRAGDWRSVIDEVRREFKNFK